MKAYHNIETRKSPFGDYRSAWDASGTLMKVVKAQYGYEVYFGRNAVNDERGVTEEYVGHWETLRELSQDLAKVTFYVG